MNLFEPTTPSTPAIESACVIEDCARPTYAGLCNACMILFGPYAGIVESPDVEEWTPPTEPDEQAEADPAMEGRDEQLQPSEHAQAQVPVQPAAQDLGREPLSDAPPAVNESAPTEQVDQA